MKPNLRHRWPPAHGGEGASGAPTILGFSPAVGDTYGGNLLTLTVSGMVTGVQIGGTDCTSVVQSGTTVTCRSPAKSAGTYDVVVSGPRGVSDPLTSSYEAWHPTFVVATARAYQSDQGVVSSSTDTSWRMGVQSNVLPKAFSATVGSDVPLDGQGMLELPSGRFLIAGGAPQGHAAEVVNTIWCSDDRGKTWSELQPSTSGSSTRPAPAHTFGFFRLVWNGVDYVYWLGGDPFAPTGNVFRIPSSALDVGGDPTTLWELVSTTCPTSGLALYLYGVLGTTIYVGAGQVDINNGAANKHWWKSTDGGATWTDMGAIVPANVWGDQLQVLPVKNGMFWICGSGRYDSTINDFSNAVVTFDGTTFTTQLADGHAQFPKSRYHSCVVDGDGRLWRVNGTTWDGTTLVADTTSLYHSDDGLTWTSWADPFCWGNTHAQAMIATSDGIYLTNGFQSSQVYRLVQHTGPLASSWADRGSTGLTATQATPAAKPIVDPNGFPSQPGLAFTLHEWMSLSTPDRNLTNGVFEAYAVLRTYNFKGSSSQGINPPCVVVGESDGSSWNNFGLSAAGVEFRSENPSLQIDPPGGAGIGTVNDDATHVIGISQDASGHRIYIDGVLVYTGTGGINTQWTGWDSIGAGYLNADGGAFVLGALVIIADQSSPVADSFRTKLQAWAKKWM